MLIKAKRVDRPGLELVVAIIEWDGHSWATQAYLSERTKHPPNIKRATCATLEAAVEHIRAMSLEYPNSKDVPVIINDLGG